MILLQLSVVRCALKGHRARGGQGPVLPEARGAGAGVGRHTAGAMISFICPQCKSDVTAPATAVGKVISSLACGAWIRVPELEQNAHVALEQHFPRKPNLNKRDALRNR